MVIINIKLNMLKGFVLFLIGGFLYYFIEIIWRGCSHISMFIVGGIAFVLVGSINKWFSWKMPIWEQCLMATGIIVILEFLSGYIVNIWLGLGIWDYSHLPYNLLGQIQLYYVILWYVLSGVAILLDDYIRWKSFKEEKPRYKLW